MPTPYRIEAIALKDVGVFDNVLIHFKPIEDAEVDEQIAEVHLFTGPNGSGKSTLLYALAELFYSFSQSSIKPRLGENFIIEFLFSNEPYRIHSGKIIDLNNSCSFGILYAINNHGSFYYSTPQIASYEKTTISDPRAYSATTSTYNPESKTRKPLEFAAFAFSGQRELGSARVDAIKELPPNPLNNALEFSVPNRFSQITQWVANTITKSAIAQQAKRDDVPDTYRSSLDKICQFIHSVCGLTVRFELELSPFSVSLIIDDEHVPLDTLPDGLKSILSWVCDLALRLERIPWATPGDIFAQPIILFLDEIDIHLHPKWQRRILPALQKLLPNAQVFASTHSPFVVGSVDNAWIYVLPEKGKQKEREIRGVKSNPAESYRLILKEIFSIDEEFGEEIENLFNEFYACRDKYLETKHGVDELRALAERLRASSEEVALIIDREMRQIDRMTNKS
jgi:predicted ATP-binding protein involved in virulence